MNTLPVSGIVLLTVINAQFLYYFTVRLLSNYPPWSEVMTLGNPKIMNIYFIYNHNNIRYIINKLLTFKSTLDRSHGAIILAGLEVSEVVTYGLYVTTTKSRCWCK